MIDQMPTTLTLPKPISAKPCTDNGKPNREIQALIDANRLWAQRKANGVRCYYVVSDSSKTLYTRTGNDASEHFAPLKVILDDLPIPVGSIIDMETTLGGGYTDEQFRAAGSMVPNTSPERAAVIYADWLRAHPQKPLAAYAFDVVYWGGVEVIGSAYEERFAILEGMDDVDESFTIPENMTFCAGTAQAAAEKSEGCVLWDRKMKSRVSDDGRPKRPRGCWKWKTVKHADCFIVEVRPEKCVADRVGSLVLAQYDAMGRRVECGRVSAGLSEVHKTEAWGWNGRAVKIQYDERMPTNARGHRCFRNPRLCGLHEDKTQIECIA